jgi:hypothetical protein
VEREEARINGARGGSQRSRRTRTAERWRDRYQGSVAKDLISGLGEVEFGNWIILFGASFLLSVLPLIILLNAFANSRVDDDIATRLGLSREGSQIIDSLFSQTHAGWNFGVVVALLLSLAERSRLRAPSRGSTSRRSITPKFVGDRMYFGASCGRWQPRRRSTSMQ